MNYDPLDMEKTISRDEVQEGCSLKAGDKLGQYLIVRLLGKGGMGEVYEAENDVNHKRVALKLLPRAVTGGTFVDRFRVESRVMMDMRHPHTVQVHHAGEENGLFYLTMDLVLGPEGKPMSLEERLAKGRLSSKEAAELALQICDTVAYAHARQIIHRDLKPLNVLIDDKGGAQVADFGLAKVVGTEYLQAVIQKSISLSLAERSIGETATMPGPGRTSTVGSSAQALLGTYDYMAPEQKAGQEATTRSDVFALGVILYRMLTGRKPEGRFKLPSHYGHPKGWDPIVSKCLEPDPTERYADAGELRQALAPLAGVVGVRSPAGAGRWVALAIGAVVLVGLVAAGFMAARPGKAKPGDPAGDASQVKNQAESMWKQVQALDLGQKFADFRQTNWLAGLNSSKTLYEKGNYTKAEKEYRTLASQFTTVLGLGDARRKAEEALAQNEGLAGVPGFSDRLADYSAQRAKIQELIDGMKFLEAEGAYEALARELAQLQTLNVVRERVASALAKAQGLSRGHNFGTRLDACANQMVVAAAAVAKASDAEGIYLAVEKELDGLTALDDVRKKAVDAHTAIRALDSGQGFEAWVAACSNGLEEAGALTAEKEFLKAQEKYQALIKQCDEVLRMDSVRKAGVQAREKAVAARAETVVPEQWQSAEETLAAALGAFKDGHFSTAQGQWNAAAAGFDSAAKQAREMQNSQLQQKDLETKNQAKMRVSADYAALIGLPTAGKRKEWLKENAAGRKAQWTEAAELGVPEAQILVAALYHEGILVEASGAKAVAWYNKAATSENSEAQVALGEMYETGQGGVTRDLVKAREFYQKAASNGNARAQNNLGEMYLNGRGVRGDEKQAADLFRQAAAGKYFEAAANLGWMYEQGLGGLGMNETNALKLYRIAASNGVPIAYSHLGRMCEQGRGGLAQDDVAAVSWYRRAANAGDADGGNNLGRMYEQGRGGLEQDDVKAFNWFRLAASNGNANAKNNLGRMYEEGRGGLPQDYNQAKKYFLEAAAAKDVEGQYNLGRAYEQGWGLPRPDFAGSAGYYQGAADKGHVEAQFILGQFYENSRPGVPRDAVKAVNFYGLAARQGHLAAQKNLARIYEKGFGVVPKNDTTAAQWQEKAASQGDLGSQLAIAGRYEKGMGVRPDDAAAAKWYRQAADQGSAAAQNKLGEMCRDGRGVGQDDVKALEWFQKAARQGDLQAKKNLAVLGKILRKKGVKVEPAPATDVEW